MIIELFFSLLYYIIPFLIGLLTVIVIYVRWNYGKLEKIKGLPAVVKPSFIGGSDFWLFRKVMQDEDLKNVKKYGKVYGFYEWRAPMIYVADVELIKLILVKDFHHFNKKRSLNTGTVLFDEMTDVLPYEKWKIVRTLISPLMTTGRLKGMCEEITEVIKEWMETFKGKMEKEKSFDPKPVFTAVATDIFTRCFFGTKMNCLDDPNNAVLKNINELIPSDGETNAFILFIFQMFPIVASLGKIFPLLPTKTLDFFRNLIGNVMKSRLDANIKQGDFMDILNEMQAKVGKDPDYIRMNFSDDSVKAQAMAMFIGGFGTTSETLSLTVAMFAKHPEIQEKALAELDEYLARHSGKIEYETVGELKYLEACLQETLRMFPLLHHLDRECTLDWHHEPSGLHIPKGMDVVIPVQAIHHDEEYYPEPEKYKPERFLPENKNQLNPSAFLGFGLGNHNCVGMRFGKLSSHMILANVLKNFEFRQNSETKVEPNRGQIFTTFKPFSVDILSRN